MGQQTTGWGGPPSETESSEARRTSGESLGQRIPDDLRDPYDNDGDGTTGFPRSDFAKPAKPGSLAGVPEDISSRGVNSLSAPTTPTPQRYGTKRQRYSQAPNKG